MRRLTINDIQKMKNKIPIVCLTSYTASITKAIEKHVDVLLIGDSLGTVIYGMNNTQSISLNMMKEHGKVVVQFSERPFTIIDMPHKSYQDNKSALNHAKQLLNYTKCQSVKIEVNDKNVGIVSYLSRNNIDVVSHIGVTPQSFSNFSKIKIVGKTTEEKKRLINLALNLQDAGSSLIVLECITKETAKEITSRLRIPTIGIGSSVYCDGQILVVNDLLGLNTNFKKPKFVKTYLDLSSQINRAVQKYSKEVKKNKFPSKKYTY